jgi:serpin B
VANAVFAQRGFDIERDFLDALARDFGAGLRTVDFTDGGAAAAINDWVKTQTRERIDKLFDQLDPETRLVLANAVYLKATWVHRFAPDMTHRSPFHRLDGTVVRPETMHTARPVRLGHAAGNGWAAVRLPYVGDELAMWVLLPSAQDADPVGLLDPAVLGSAIEAAVSRRVALSLPKWRVRSDLALVDALAQLGMTRPFLDLADFSGISPVRLKIDQVQHRADITVDEEGTEAAAVTGIAMVPVSAPPPPDAVMTVDHPFAFVVVHEPTGAPLFEGVVGDPTATQ